MPSDGVMCLMVDAVTVAAVANLLGAMSYCHALLLLVEEKRGSGTGMGRWSTNRISQGEISMGKQVVVVVVVVGWQHHFHKNVQLLFIHFIFINICI